MLHFVLFAITLMHAPKTMKQQCCTVPQHTGAVASSGGAGSTQQPILVMVPGGQPLTMTPGGQPLVLQ